MGMTKPLSYCMFDGLQWNSTRGLGRYARQLGRHLERMPWERLSPARPAWKSGLGRVLLSEMVEPIWREVLRADIAFYPHNVLPFVFLSHRSLRVLVLHDVLFLDSENRSAGNHYRSLKLRGSLSKADLIITVSETSRREILDKLSVRCPVVVIPNALAESFASTVEKPEARKQGPTRILHFGGTSPTKNTRNVLRAAALLGGRGFDIHLEIAAMSARRDLVEQWRHEAELGANSLTVLPSLSDAELREAYRGSDIHCMPSTGEGFGIPVIEAASIGTPNVLSPIDVFRELMGEDAVYAASLEAAEIADAIQQCLSLDTQAMTERAKQRADRFVFDPVHSTHAVPVLQAIEVMVDARNQRTGLHG
jgi:glycosyltransferase involved in cell wall biosynthesis